MRPVNRRTVLAAAGVGLLAAGCKDGNDGTALARAGKPPVEISVGYTPVPDSAPLHIAKQQGLFEKHGLRVTLQNFQKQIIGDVDDPGKMPDISHLSWVYFLGATDHGSDWRIIGEAYQAVAGSTGLYVPEGSDYRRLQDLRRPRIATNTPVGLGTLLSNARLEAAGIPTKDIAYSYIAFDEMPDALAKDKADAVWLPEPFITQYALEHGLQPLADTTTADTANFPLSGYSCERRFAERRPEVVKAFQRAIGEAQEQAATDRAAVERVFQRHMGLSPMTTSLMTIGTFPLSLQAARPQRVADLMFNYGVLRKRVDVRKLMLR